MKSKKGWLKILEAFIAIALIGGFLVFIYTLRVGDEEEGKDIYELEEVLLDEVRANNRLREKVLKNDKSSIENYFEGRIPSGFNYSVNICNAERICGPSKWRENTYSDSIVISANLTRYEPKKLRLFIWKEKIGRD